MNHKQRMEACISGTNIDRPPVALWRHFPVADQDPTLLAHSVIHFQETYDWDFVKITPASSFFVRDYGVKDTWRGNPEGTRDYTKQPIDNPQKWLNLAPLDPRKGALGDQLSCVQQVRESIGKDTPVIQTIFDPMSQAKNLSGKDNLLVLMRQSPESLHKGLEILAQNTVAFIKECIKLNIDGFFFAIQHAQAGILNLQEYREFVEPYDLEILSTASKLWMNLIHIHGSNIYFDRVSQYPASILNWHDQETAPSLSAGKSIFPGAVCGGLRQWETLVYGTPDVVKSEAKRAIEETHGERFILGTGCVLPITAPHCNITSARQAVENKRIL